MKRFIERSELLAAFLLWVLSIALIAFSTYSNYRICRGYFRGMSLPVCMFSAKLPLVVAGGSQ